jgi:phage-related protein
MMAVVDLGDFRAEIVLDDSQFSKKMKKAEQDLQNFEKKTLSWKKTIASALLPALAPSVSALTGGILALGSSFASAGVGAVAFGAVAVSSLQSVFDAAEEVQKLEEKIANADTYEERIKAQQELAKLYQGMSEAQRNAVKDLQNFKSFWGDFTKQFETPIFQSFSNVLQGVKTIFQGLAPTIRNVADVVVELTSEFNQALQSSSVKGLFEWLETHAAESLYNFAHIFGNTFMSVMNLLKAFSPLGASIEEGLVRLTQRFSEWSASLSQSTTFQQFLNYIKESGSMLISIFGNVFKTISSLIVAISPIASVVGSAFLQIVNTVTSFIAKLAEALASSESFRNGVTTVFYTIRTVVSQVISVVRDFVVQKVQEIKTFWEQNGEQIRAAAEKVFNFISTIVTNTMPIVLDTIKNAWEGIKKVISGTINIITGVIKTFSAVLTGDWKGAWEGVKSIAQGVWNVLTGALKTFTSGMQGTISLALNTVKNIFSSVWNGIKSLVSNIWNSIKSAISSTLSGIVTNIQSSWNNAKTFVSNTLNSIRSTVSSIWNGIKSTISTIAGSIYSSISSKFNSAKSTVSSIFNSIKSTATSVWNGIKTAITSPIEKARDIVLGIIDKIKSAFEKFEIKIPKPKLPHINVDWKSFGVGDLSVKVPTFSVDWYQTGGIFDKPSIVGLAENGREAILPLENPTYMAPFADAVWDRMKQNMQNENITNNNQNMHIHNTFNFSIAGAIDERTAQRAAKIVSEKIITDLKLSGMMYSGGRPRFI